MEHHIGDTYNAASLDRRSAVGLVMTIYRRWLASNFKALEKALLNRLGRVDLVSDETESQDETRDDPDDDRSSELARSAGELEERERIVGIFKEIAQLGANDSKAGRLKRELQECCGEAHFNAAIVFTQYAYTMEYLREYLVLQMDDVSVASYSGGGGAWRDTGGPGTPATRRRLSASFWQGRLGSSSIRTRRARA